MTDRINDLTSAVDGRNQACYAVPTRSQRFWSFTGFRFHLGEEPKGHELLPGWVQTKIGIHFGFVDRLRLLFSGKLKIYSTVYMDTPSPATCMSRMDWHILKPRSELRGE
jgi:hypothetical protein